MNKNKLIIYFYNSLFIFCISIIILFILMPSCFAATPKIISKLNTAFENIESWMLKIATPAAAVAVAVGLFMKKFSFGEEERIRTAKKMIRGSLIAYGLLLAIDLILQAIQALIG